MRGSRTLVSFELDVRLNMKVHPAKIPSILREAWKYLLGKEGNGGTGSGSGSRNVRDAHLLLC